MASSIQRLARWARDLTLDQAPAPVVERLRLQQVGLAGSARALGGWGAARRLAAAAGGRGAAAVVTGGTASRREAARLHTALACWLEHDDHLLHGRPGAAAAATAWAWSGGHDLGAVLAASLAAQEVAGRLGLSLLLGPDQEGAEPVLAAVAAATAAGLLEGLDADQLAHAIALAGLAPARLTAHDLGLSGGPALARARAVVHGVDAVAQARAGLTGPVGSWDDRDGLVGSLTPAPLRAAFTGLGRAWLTLTLGFHLHPGAPHVQAPVQAVHEILRRHVKAADKRLRSDQVERIEVALSGPAWWAHQRQARAPVGAADTLPRRLPALIGHLVAHHALEPAQLDPEVEDPRQGAVAEVARRVVVVHAPHRSRDLAEHLVDTLGPVLTGLTAPELDAALAARDRLAGGGLGPRREHPLAAVRDRAWRGRLLARVAYGSGDLADARLDELQHRLGADVRLYTTRGGSWPEHRDLAEGGPGWPWEQTRAAVLARWGEPEAARALAEAPSDTAAQPWVEALLRGG